MTAATNVEHAVEIKGASVSMHFPAEFDSGDIAETVAHIEGMIDGFGESQAKGKEGAQHYFAIVTKVDPDCTKGHALYYDDYVRDLKKVVRASTNVSEQAISRFFSGLREDLDPTHPWYLDPNRTETSTSGGPAKGSKQQTSHSITERVIEDPDAFEVEGLVTALQIRLRNLDPKTLKNAVGFITEIEDLADAIKTASGLVHGWVRQGGGA